MKTNQYEIKVVKRCPKCDWRIFDKVTPTSGIIELKCPNCRKVSHPKPQESYLLPGTLPHLHIRTTTE